MSKKKIALQITSEGGIQMLQDDEVDLREFGRVNITRASEVWFHNVEQYWVVSSAKNLDKILAYGFKTRAEAIEWEREYFSPNGEGWKELTG